MPEDYNYGTGRRLLSPRMLFAYLFVGVIAYLLVVYVVARNNGRLALPAGAPSAGMPMAAIKPR